MDKGTQFLLSQEIEYQTHFVIRRIFITFATLKSEKKTQETVKI